MECKSSKCCQRIFFIREKCLNLQVSCKLCLISRVVYRYCLVAHEFVLEGQELADEEYKILQGEKKGKLFKYRSREKLSVDLLLWRRS